MASAEGVPIPGKDYFTTLPPEILEMITGHLTLFKKLELRRIFPKSQSAFVNEQLKSALATLYVSPNRLSVVHFGHICRVNFFRHRVTKVIFVPQTLAQYDEDNALIETINVYRNQHQELSRREAQDSFNLYLNSVEELIPYSTEISGIDDGVHHNEGISIDLSKALVGGLIRLPALKTVGVTTKIDQEGLNSNWCMLSRRLKSTQQSNSAVHAAQLSLRQVPREFEHVNTFFHALETLAPQLETMFIGENRDIQLPFGIQTRSFINPFRMQSSMQYIKQLTISCTDNLDLEVYDTDPVWIKIAESAPQLQHLRLYAAENDEPSAWREIRGGAKALDHFLNFGRYEKLKKLEIIGRAVDMSVINAKKLENFLLRHGQTLEEVRLEEVLLACLQMVEFETPDGGLGDPRIEEIDEEEVCVSLRALLSTAGSVMPKLELLHVEVKRSYEKWFKYQVMESLAKELGVVEKEGVWVFKQVKS